MFTNISHALHHLIGFALGVVFLPIAYLHVFFPLGLALAVVVWPLAFFTCCIAALTSFVWIPALILSLIALAVVSFFFQVLISLIGTFRDAFARPPQHPQPYREVPALSSGIPASRSDSVVAGYGFPSAPGTPGPEAAADMSAWLEKRFADMVERDELDDVDEFGLVTPASRGLRSYPPRRSSSSTAGASIHSINAAAALDASTASVNSITSAYPSAPPSAILTGPSSPNTPSRRRSRTKSMSFEDGSRPGLSASHSTTSMVTGSSRVSSQHEVNSSSTSLASNAGSASGSIESAVEAMRMGQLLTEMSDDNITRH